MTRSLLFIPANTPAMLKNSDLHEADVVIFDLEDAIRADEKDAARLLLKAFLEDAPFQPNQISVRINPVDSLFFEDDLRLIPLSKIQSIMLPKADVSSVLTLAKILEKHKASSPSIIAIIETAKGLLTCEGIASHPVVSGLLLGAEDLATDLRAKRTPEGEEILFARSQIITAARAFGKDAFDTPWTTTDDHEGLIQDARFARRLGMNGKAAIHPLHIKAINQVFSPSVEEIRDAKRILMTAKDHQGAFQLDGKMIDRPIIQRAEAIMDTARTYGLIHDD